MGSGCGRYASVGAVVEAGPVGPFHAEYELRRKLGQGAYGQVREARHRWTEELFAVKIVRDAQCEEATWRRIGKHDNCVELLNIYQEQSLYYMIMELCGPSLLDRFYNLEPLSPPELSCIFRDMLLGVQHLHDCGLVHRDVKLDNFVCGGSDRDQVKLCDFGSAVALPGDGLILDAGVGTAPYMSPEMLGGAGYAEKTDIWSLGVSAYLCICGEFPYNPPIPNVVAMKNAILSGLPTPSFEPNNDGGFRARGPLPPGAQAFLRTLLERAVPARCSADEALALPFVQGRPLPPEDADTPRVEVIDVGPRKTSKEVLRRCQETLDSTEMRNLDHHIWSLQERHRRSTASVNEEAGKQLRWAEFRRHTTDGTQSCQVTKADSKLVLQDSDSTATTEPPERLSPRSELWTPDTGTSADWRVAPLDIA